MHTGQRERPVVVGVRRLFSERVVAVAADFARRLGTQLVCVVVDPSQLVMGHRADGSEIVEPVDPDAWGGEPEQIPEDVAARIRAVADAAGVQVRLQARVADPSRTLAKVADEVDAVVIVVGTRPGRHRVAEFFNASVAAQLAHRQHRPVLVVPTNPVGFDGALPWEEE